MEENFFAYGKKLEVQSQINGEILEWPGKGDNIQITMYRTFGEYGLERGRVDVGEKLRRFSRSPVEG